MAASTPLAKLGSNAYWWGIWALVLAAFFVRAGTPWLRRREVVLFLLTILYFWAIDSVFESGGRHHLPLVGLLAILAASITESITESTAESTAEARPLPARAAGQASHPR